MTYTYFSLLFAMNLHTYCIHWHKNISNTATYFPSGPHLAVSRVLHQTISILWHDSAKCKVLFDSIGVMDNKFILSTFEHCTLLEELYQLNIPWKQVKYSTDNAYQAVSRVLHEFVTCVTRVN